MPHVRGLGERCLFDAHCAKGTCVEALDDDRLSFCTLACIQGRCPEGTACVDDLCRAPGPSPGSDGTSCGADDECAGELCLAPAGETATVCTQRCFTDLPGFECPGEMTCHEASDGQEACFVDDGGCCSSSRSNASWLALLLLAQLLRGRGKP
jgi:hypothetical protein